MDIEYLLFSSLRFMSTQYKLHQKSVLEKKLSRCQFSIILKLVCFIDFKAAFIEECFGSIQLPSFLFYIKY